MRSSVSRPPSGTSAGFARTAGRRSALGRLAASPGPVTVPELTMPEPGSMPGPGSMPEPTVPTHAVPVSAATDVIEVIEVGDDTEFESEITSAPTASTGGWGVTSMPTWLGSDTYPADFRGEGGRDDDGDTDSDDDEFPRRRIGMAPPAAIVIILVGVLALAFAGYSLMRDRSVTATPVAFPASAGPTTSAGGPAHPTSPRSSVSAVLVVSVVGLVRRPGLVRVPPDARVADAIAKAGGARDGADLLSLNMAQPVRDGDQILVGYVAGEGRMSMRSNVVSSGGQPSPTAVPNTSGSPGGAASDPAPAPAAGAGSGSGTAGGKVDLNSASETQLDALPGVGPVTAKAIVAWREKNGRFTSVEQLGEVDGIGPAKLARLRDLVTV